MQNRLDSIIENVSMLTNYNDEKVIEYFFYKLVTKIKSHCKIEELNAPLFDFVEDRLLNIARSEKAKEEAVNGTGGFINGIEVGNIKSITRGDTSITLKDSEKAIKSVSGEKLLPSDEYLLFTKQDYAVLNRYRRVYRSE